MKYVLTIILVAAALSGRSVAQTAEEGKAIFKKRCTACHQVGTDAKNRVGPILTGVVGRPAGSLEGFRYSKSMIAAGDAGLIWDQGNVVEYLLDPSKFLRKFLNDPKAKGKMTFKLKKEEDRQAVVAYLATIEIASATTRTDFVD